MMDRKKHHWRVQLQRSDSQMVEHNVKTYWDPTREDSAEAVMTAARAELHVKHHGSYDFAALSAHLVAA